MLRVYYLPILNIFGSEEVAGVDIIHDAVLTQTEQPNVYQLLMDTTNQEHDALLLHTISDALPTPEQEQFFYDTIIIYEVIPDTLRAEELLSMSAPVITMPEIWELLRIIGRNLGYKF